MFQFWICLVGDMLSALAMGVFVVSYWLDVCRYTGGGENAAAEQTITQE